MNETIREAAARLRAAGFESARREARILWEHATKLSLSPTGGEGQGEGDAGSQKTETGNQNRFVFASDSDFRFPIFESRTPPHPDHLPQWGRGDVLCIFESLIARRLAHEPVAYIVGEKEFWSLPFSVGPGVLVPRPETETLIEQAMREFPDRGAALRVLDFGTGSGCLLVTFLTEYPNAKGAGVDVSENAVKWAAANAARHSVSGRCEFALTDWQSQKPAQHDVVFANPPYIPSGELEGLPPDVKGYEPESALNGGLDGLAAYRALAPLLWDNLAPEGRAFLEIGQGQHHMVSQILKRNGLKVLRIIDDLADIPRCVVVRPGRGPCSGSSK